MNVYALIPARGGSERVPSKNVRLLGGKPLIAYTIEAAKRSTEISRVVVSTDSPEIAEIARRCGAEVPFLRPAEISGTKSTELEFLDHAIAWFAGEAAGEPDVFALLYPTSPFRKPESIDKAIRLLKGRPDADSLRSVRLCSEHPYKMWTIENGNLVPFVREKDSAVHTLPYQRLPTIYIQNASIYLIRPGVVRRLRSPAGNVVVPFVMDDVESVDINNPLDFQFAEMILRQSDRR